MSFLGKDEYVTVINKFSSNFSRTGVVTEIQRRDDVGFDYKIKMVTGPNKGHSFWYTDRGIEPKGKPSEAGDLERPVKDQPYILIEEDGDHHAFESKEELEDFMNDLVDDDGSTHRLNEVKVYRLDSTKLVDFNVKIGVED